MLLILYIVLFNIYSEGDDTIQLVPLEKISRNIKKKKYVILVEQAPVNRCHF